MMNSGKGRKIRGYSRTTKLVLGAVFAALSAIVQSAGIFVGFGYIFSMFATLPIVLAMDISNNIGIMSYFLTILMLLIIQPSELLVFTFTTGILGIGLGAALKWWNNWLPIILFAGITLTVGIMILLYVLQFPILGPSVSRTINSKWSILIFLFALFYSWIWMWLCQKLFLLLQRFKAKTN